MPEPSDFRQVLDEIKAKDPLELSDYDKAFLKSRVSYLTGAQRKKFESVLGVPKSKEPTKVINNK